MCEPYQLYIIVVLDHARDRRRCLLAVIRLTDILYRVSFTVMLDADTLYDLGTI